MTNTAAVGALNGASSLSASLSRKRRYNDISTLTSSSDNVHRLYIGGCPDSLSRDELINDFRTRFAPFGQVLAVDIIGAPTSKGFAYITLSASADEIKRCIRTYNGVKWRSKIMRIQLAKLNYLSRLGIVNVGAADDVDDEDDDKKHNATVVPATPLADLSSHVWKVKCGERRYVIPQRQSHSCDELPALPSTTHIEAIEARPTKTTLSEEEWALRLKEAQRASDEWMLKADRVAASNKSMAKVQSSVKKPAPSKVQRSDVAPMNSQYIEPVESVSMVSMPAPDEEPLRVIDFDADMSDDDSEAEVYNDSAGLVADDEWAELEAEQIDDASDDEHDIVDNDNGRTSPEQADDDESEWAHLESNDADAYDKQTVDPTDDASMPPQSNEEQEAGKRITVQDKAENESEEEGEDEDEDEDEDEKRPIRVNDSDSDSDPETDVSDSEMNMTQTRAPLRTDGATSSLSYNLSAKAKSEQSTSRHKPAAKSASVAESVAVDVGSSLTKATVPLFEVNVPRLRDLLNANDQEQVSFALMDSEAQPELPLMISMTPIQPSALATTTLADKHTATRDRPPTVAPSFEFDVVDADETTETPASAFMRGANDDAIITEWRARKEFASFDYKRKNRDALRRERKLEQSRQSRGAHRGRARGRGRGRGRSSQ